MTSADLPRGLRTVLRPRASTVGGLPVARLLPRREQRSVGPVVFLDRFGPHAFGPGGGLQVPPHPHAGLATVTYPFEGELIHRDSLGTTQSIRPGALNWMTAGRGIVHSERTPRAAVAAGGRLDGVQLWCALPAALEACAPRFEHRSAEELPVFEGPGWRARLAAGEGFGGRAPIETECGLFLADVALDPAGRLEVSATGEERAVYAVEGPVGIGGGRLQEGGLAVLEAGASVRVEASAAARVLVLGGPPLDGPRWMAGNFVASAPEALEEAMAGGAAGRFGTVPHDPGG